MIELKEGQYFGENIQAFKTDWASVSITNYDECMMIQDHHHENHYLSLLIQGQYLENSPAYSNLVKPGEILFRPSHYTHSNRFGKVKGACFNIELKPNWKDFFEYPSALPKEVIHFKEVNFPALFNLLLNFKNHFREDYCIEFISEWLDHINSDKSPNYKPWINTIISILENELGSFHSLASLSERVKAHPVYMSRTFKANTGLTIGEYQLRAKLKSSIKTLFTTQDSINEISFTHGFFDDAHFIRSFRKMYGVSPNQFRLQIKS